MKILLVRKSKKVQSDYALLLNQMILSMNTQMISIWSITTALPQVIHRDYGSYMDWFPYWFRYCSFESSLMYSMFRAMTFGEEEIWRATSWVRVEKERKIIKDDGASSSSPGNEWKRKEEEEKFVSRKRRIIGSGRSREEEQDEEVRPKYQEKRERIVNVSIQVSDVFSERRSRKKRKKREKRVTSKSSFPLLLLATTFRVDSLSFFLPLLPPLTHSLLLKKVLGGPPSSCGVYDHIHVA